MEATNEIISVFWIGTLSMLVLVFVLIFMVLFYQNHLSKVKRDEVENLLKIALETEKNERQRIASDLHDSVSSDLSAIRNFILHILKHETDSGKRELLEDLKTGVLNAIENTRMISYKLMPPLLYNYGFLVALDDYCEQLQKKTKVSFTVDSRDTTIAIDTAKGYELFRVMQEFTTNMLKYGSISFCKIIVYSLDTIVYIELIDDGIPYNFSDCLATSIGSGLRNIDARIKFVGGSLEQREVSVGNHFVLSILSPIGVRPDSENYL
jgi:signal transduction histidine kinase